MHSSPASTRPAHPLRVAVLAPIQSSLYSRLVSFLALTEPGLDLVGIVVRTPWSWSRLRGELRRDGKRLARKVFQKMVLGERAYAGGDQRTIAALAREVALPGQNLAALARLFNVPLRVVRDHNEPAAVKFLQALRPDVLAFTGGGLIRRAVLELPGLGVLNCHLGPLPAYRGMDVVEWPVLEQSRAQIGLTLHWMDQGVDTGPLLLQQALPLEPGDSFAAIRRRLEPEMVRLVLRGLRGLRDGVLAARPQPAGAGKQYFVMHDRLLAVAARRLAVRAAG
jgi:folate-dependent phosphoribosylglycinamide formyltransferase PurN